MNHAAPFPVGDGRFTVPGNRFDLLPRPSRPPTVSVILPFYDQQPQFERLLAGVALQSGPAEVVEVLVGDDGSPEPPVVPDWYDGPPVRVESQPDRGVRPAAARNLAAAAARGEVYVFLDADMVPSPGYVDAAAALPAVCPEALVVGTRHHYDLAGCDHAAVTDWLTGRSGSPPRLDDPRWLDDGYRGSRHLLDLDARSYQWVIGAVTTVAAPLFRELGGFDDSIDVYGGEDWDLAFRAVHAGAVLAHVDAVAFHDGPDWRGRVGPNGSKNPERRALIERIPSLDDGIWTAEPLVDVVIDVGGWDPDAALVTAADVLRAAAGGLRLTVVGADPATAALLRGDPRVVLDRPAPSSGRTALRCEVRVPVETQPGSFHDLLRATGPDTPGRVRVVDADGVLLHAESARVGNRVRRWSGAGLDADALFGPEVVLDADDGGVRRRETPVDLADAFPR
jgi:GT2 family glycosyltransferase